MKIITKLSFLLLITIIITSCVSTKYAGNYIVRNSETNKQILKDSGTYFHTNDPVVYNFDISEERTREIQGYFTKEGIPQNWLNTELSTWERSMLIAVWVAQNIKHSNPSDYPKIRNSIALWEYSKTHPAGFNCRMHSILCSELFTAAGIYNRFVTCQSSDPDDPDCHVVNVVWLPEFNKWAMIDSDMKEYVTDNKGAVLSLQEMRKYVIEDIPFEIHPLEGLTANTDYLIDYWNKNLFCFSNYGTYGYSLEDDTVFHDDDEQFYYLVPAFENNGFIQKNRHVIITNDEEKFWAPPF